MRTYCDCGSSKKANSEKVRTFLLMRVANTCLRFSSGNEVMRKTDCICFRDERRSGWGGGITRRLLIKFVTLQSVIEFTSNGYVAVLRHLAWIFHWEPERGTLPPLFEFPMTTFSEKDRFSKFWTQYPLTPKCSAGREYRKNKRRNNSFTHFLFLLRSIVSVLVSSTKRNTPDYTGLRF